MMNKCLDARLFPNRHGANCAGAILTLNGKHFCAVLLAPDIEDDVILIACTARNHGIACPRLEFKVPEKDNLCMPVMKAELVGISEAAAQRRVAIHSDDMPILKSVKVALPTRPPDGKRK